MPQFEVVWPKGVGYRTAPSLEAKAEDRVPAKRGDVVVGQAVEGWVATEDGFYLPLQTPDGTPLVKRKPDFIPWQGVCEEEGGSLPSGSGPARSGSRPASRGREGEVRLARNLVPGGGGAGSELDALHQKYDKKYGRPRAANAISGAAAVAPPLGQLVNSHDRTTAYMHEFRRGLEDMGVDTRDDPYLNAYAPTGPSAAGRRPLSTSAGASRGASRPSSRASVGGGRATSASALQRSQPGSPSLTGEVGAGGLHLALCGAMVVTRSASSGSTQTWREGPANAIVPVKEWMSVKHGKEVKSTCSSGRVIDVSDRNVMCMSLLGEKAVLGSADHGLKEVNVRSGQMLRNLYTKRFGHTEWVTTVSHCLDGRIISGGLDSKLCLWNSSGVACVDLTGHLGSISRVRTHAQHHLAISSGYDKTLRAWDLRAKTELACCTGHDAPVMEFIWADDVVASGDRSGSVRVWDACRAEHIAVLKGHKGHITAMLALPESCAGGGAGTPTPGGGGTPAIATGAQDGHIRIWDLRQKLNTFNLSAHAGGAVNEMGVTMGSSAPLVVSVGADGRLLVLEPRQSFAPLSEFSGITEDFIYSLLVLDDLAFVGDGRGQVTCFDVRSGQKRYVLDAGQNAIRCLAATATSLICSGDDGNAVIFDF
mmetsp:Transcript_94287/g.281356  ORF Transcript_94287/g.281356 Transcript_94287/m.281356 type:complete len:650 (-) Transcript_94287:94-2043(-)